MNSKLKLLLSVCVVAVLAIFAAFDTGVFVKNYGHKLDNGQTINFQLGEIVSLSGENDDSFTISKAGNVIRVPKLNMMRLTHTAKTATVIDMTELNSEKDGGFIRFLIPGEELKVLSCEGPYAKVEAQEGVSGYVSIVLINLKMERNTSFGVATLDKRLYSGDNTYNLVKGYPVKIVGFEDGKFTIIDEAGNEFKAEYSDIEVTHVYKAVEKVKAEVVDAEKGGLNAPNKGMVAKLLARAGSSLGTPYVWGGTSPNGYDCSGFVYSMFKNQLGISLTRTTYTQVKEGRSVPRDQMMAGDLVFFNTSGNSVSHVGIYIGDGQFIHASSGKGQVIISSLSEGYYNSRFVAARRIIPE